MAGLEVVFVKVDSHTGDLFNELVDEKCKEKLGINSDKTVEKWLNKNIINVSSEGVKEEILKIAPKGEKNIIVINSNDGEKNKNEIRIYRFDEIVSEYIINPERAKSLINNFSSSEKTDFIIFLLEGIK